MPGTREGNSSVWLPLTCPVLSCVHAHTCAQIVVPALPPLEFHDNDYRTFVVGMARLLTLPALRQNQVRGGVAAGLGVHAGAPRPVAGPSYASLAYVHGMHAATCKALLALAAHPMVFT